MYLRFTVLQSIRLGSSYSLNRGCGSFALISLHHGRSNRILTTFQTSSITTLFGPDVVCIYRASAFRTDGPALILIAQPHSPAFPGGTDVAASFWRKPATVLRCYGAIKTSPISRCRFADSPSCP